MLLHRHHCLTGAVSDSMLCVIAESVMPGLLLSRLAGTGRRRATARMLLSVSDRLSARRLRCRKRERCRGLRPGRAKSGLKGKTEEGRPRRCGKKLIFDLFVEGFFRRDVAPEGGYSWGWYPAVRQQKGSCFQEPFELFVRLLVSSKPLMSRCFFSRDLLRGHCFRSAGRGRR